MAEVGEVIQLGQASGTVVAQTTSANGQAQFSTSSGVVTGYVYQARNPDVNLDGVQVCLVQEQGTGLYAVMVDDPYWGRRIQPAQFGEAPCTETFIMGYRLTGIIQRQGVPVAAAPVSFEVTLQTAEDGEVRFWDSEEYNPLVWSDSLQTYVTGSLVTAPVVTDANGRWEYLVPKGHGAPYQRQSDRRDDTSETAEQSLPRYAQQVCVAYHGRQMPVVEGQTALLNLDSAQVQITATPGATVSVGNMEDAGQLYTVPAGGVLEVGSLPEGWVSLVQLKRAYGEQWDPSYGGQRARVPVHEGQTTNVDLGTLEQYPGDGSVACGRVFTSPGVPAAGVQITIISMDSARIIGIAATTNGSGFWSVAIGDQGLGGNLFITDPTWGTMPVVGLPYSDVVLGARAYSGWMDEFKPESWRTGTFGHKNFPYVEEAVWVVDNDTGAVYPTQPAPYGGWMTEAVLSKWKYIADPVALLRYGPQLKSYRLETDCRTEDPDFHLRDQSFGGVADEASAAYYRASGYYPEKKILVGGKIKYNVVLASGDRIDENWPEAARVGLEFGQHQKFVELRAASGGFAHA
jgi:hypothetical protein